MAAQDPPAASPEPRWTAGRRRVAAYVGVAVVVGLGIHVAYPAIAGLRRSVDLLGRADPWWIAAAFACSALSLGCYGAVFRYVAGTAPLDKRLGWRASYQIALASQAASTIVTAAGAGGIALFYWALTRAGLGRAATAARIAAFLAWHYVVYLGAIVIFGVLLWVGALPGGGPASLTIAPAAAAAAILVAIALVAGNPERYEQRLGRASARETRRARVARRLLTVPAVLAEGIQYARELLHPRRRGAALSLLAIGYWATNVAILVACFHAFGEAPALATLVQAFFVGQTVNLLPLLPGGIGSVEAGMIAALLAFGEPGAQVVVSVLSYRLISYWLPTIPEALAYIGLRRTVETWDHEPVAPSPM